MLDIEESVVYANSLNKLVFVDELGANFRCTVYTYSKQQYN